MITPFAAHGPLAQQALAEIATVLAIPRSLGDGSMGSPVVIYNVPASAIL